MSAFDSQSPPGAFGASGVARSATRPGSAAAFLLTHEVEARRDSRRVVIGFVAMLVLGVAALNVVLYRDAAKRLEREGWSHLEASSDMRRDQIARMLHEFRAEAVEMAHDPVVARLASAAAGNTLTPAEHAALGEESQARAQMFELENVEVVRPDGSTAYGLFPSDRAEGGPRAELVRRVCASGLEELGDPHGDELMAGAPILDEHDAVAAVLVLHRVDVNSLRPMLGTWPGLGASSGAYLVRQAGDSAQILTGFDGISLRQGEQVSLASPQALGPAMAATGVESCAEVTNVAGRPAWIVTRRLPEIHGGIVSQVDREDMLAPLRTTAQGLALVDVALALLVLALGWMWRRMSANALARQELEITEKHARRVQSVFDTAFDAIFTFDRDGTVRAVNRAAARLIGRDPSEVEGRCMDEFMRWDRPGANLPEPGTVGTGHALLPDGGEVPVEFSFAVSGEGGERLFTAILRDVRERLDAERRIRSFAEGLEVSNRRLEEANAQLEESSRLKSEFLANTSHELRTPLNGMIGFLQLVLDGMCDDPEEERDFLRQALQCSRHLLGLINDVLDIAKIEAGKLMLEMDRVDVRQLFDEVYTLTHVQAAQRGIELIFDPEIEDGVLARGDFGKVKQVLINLLGNSLKFTPRGRITVRAHSHVELGHIMFEVVDTGIGIPLDRQKLVFEKFVQADGSTTRRFGGTGLGLAISRSLVELMGGIIGVQSEGEGKGTRMYFSLPLWREEHSPEAHPAPVADAVQGPDSGPLVLVVEDDPVFRRFLTAVLQQSGYRTVEAGHAETGWLLARRHQPDCVVLDYALSSGEGASLRTGWDLAQRMTSEAETRRIPIVFVTGFDGELRQKLQATAFARRPEHLVKPIEGRDLIARIGALVGAGASPVRVLMADDDPTVAAYVRKVLPADRFQIQVTRNGEECLHALRTQAGAFDVLLLDLMMPEVSGYDVLREMTLAGMQPDLPVLILTNFPEARNEEERRLLERGLVLDVISKASVHENPQLLPHVLTWHLQAARDDDSGEVAA